ncbi:MAG: guanylate kinase [Lachnospiraceae bacterium]|nr:guanylate kinase [Lachnospiraceae bacterium]
MAKKGLLVVISGFSGAGKGTLMKELINKYDNYALSVSATTRQPREGEVDGREYFFKTVDEFENMIKNEQLIEYAKYVNNYYGTPRAYVDSQLEAGKDVILEIEIQGAMNIKKMYEDAVLIFILPPSAEELKRRLVGRNTETIDVINARMSRANEEAVGIENYDYVVVNDILDESVEELHRTISSAHNRVVNNINLISNIRDELNNISNKNC